MYASARRFSVNGRIKLFAYLTGAMTLSWNGGCLPPLPRADAPTSRLW